MCDIIQTKSIEDYGIEIIKLGKGACLGDSGIVYKKPRNASAIAIDDCDLFVILSNDFSNIFSVININ